jgi:hypothetical protein
MASNPTIEVLNYLLSCVFQRLGIRFFRSVELYAMTTVIAYDFLNELHLTWFPLQQTDVFPRILVSICHN